MKIGIDIDGVLTDEHRYIIDYGTNYFTKNNIQYKLHNDIYDSKEIFEVTEEQYNEFWKENLLKYSEKILIRPFASEVINKLKKNNNQIYNKYKDKTINVVKRTVQLFNEVYK